MPLLLWIAVESPHKNGVDGHATVEYLRNLGIKLDTKGPFPQSFI